LKLLLHTCCAPCAIYPARAAKKENFTAEAFFYNPNIHPYSEYIRRKKESEAYFKSEGLELIAPEYAPADFFQNINKPSYEPGRFGEGLVRCETCWGIRLEKTASFAKENGFNAFTTTLLGSPYQDHDVLKALCEKLSEEKGVNFYYNDFRIGFGDAHKEARSNGMYCQNYCGCVFSMVEREEAKDKKKQCTISVNR
jgi:predicted adenine nucleotide alpha hydrolase (AANH) superfamily ATPase